MKAWVAALALCLVSSAWAQGGVDTYRGLTPSEVKRTLEQAGYQATIEFRKGQPVIWSRLDDTRFGVFFFSCTTGMPEPRCGEIQFYAGFRIRGIFPTVLINEWNKTRRFARAYIDADHNAALEMDIDANGTTDLQLKDALLWWKTLVPDFQEFLEQTMKTS